MNNIIEEMCNKYDSSMNYANKILEKAIFEYGDFLYNEHYISEKTEDTLWTSLKKFFTILIVSIKDYIKELSIKIEYTIREKQLKNKLKKIREEILDAKNKGKHEIEIMDFWNYRNKYLELNKKLKKYANSFSKIKYTKTWQIEEDMEKFNNIINEYSEIMVDASQETITVNINIALDFVEDEIRGKSEVLKTLNDSMQLFEEMHRIAGNLRTKMDILGADVIPKHVNFIQKIANSISSFVRRFVTKFIMTVVFLFA